MAAAYSIAEESRMGSRQTGRSGIYRLLNLITGESYVGSSLVLEERSRQHYFTLAIGKGSQKLQSAYNIHGRSNFDFTILEECEPKMLSERERFWIDQLNSVAAGYNISSTTGRKPQQKKRKTERNQDYWPSGSLFRSKDYPAEWGNIRARIFERDGHRCTRCGLRNYSVVERMSTGELKLYQETESATQGRMVAEEAKQRTGKTYQVIVLACCHLDDPDPMNCEDSNLTTYCRIHHLERDRYQHSINARATKRKKKESRRWNGSPLDETFLD